MHSGLVEGSSSPHVCLAYMQMDPGAPTELNEQGKTIIQRDFTGSYTNPSAWWVICAAYSTQSCTQEPLHLVLITLAVRHRHTGTKPVLTFLVCSITSMSKLQSGCVQLPAVFTEELLLPLTVYTGLMEQEVHLHLPNVAEAAPQQPQAALSHQLHQLKLARGGQAAGKLPKSPTLSSPQPCLPLKMTGAWMMTSTFSSRSVTSEPRGTLRRRMTADRAGAWGRRVGMQGGLAHVMPRPIPTVTQAAAAPLYGLAWSVVVDFTANWPPLVLKYLCRC